MTCPECRPTRRQEIEMLVAQAVTRPPDFSLAEAIRERLEADALIECPVCGRCGVVEQIVAHDC